MSKYQFKKQRSKNPKSPVLINGNKDSLDGS